MFFVELKGLFYLTGIAFNNFHLQYFARLLGILHHIADISNCRID